MPNNIELLLHNVSHSDLVLTIADPSTEINSDRVIARPKFSHFREITKSILDSIEEKVIHNITFSTYLRHHRRMVCQKPMKYEVVPMSENALVPVGFDLRDSPVKIHNVSSLRFRRDDKQILPSAETSCHINAADFPLLAVLIPKWLQAIQYKYRPDCKLIVFLVTGRGTPNDTSARVIDNSTQLAGRLMAKFIELQYPFLEVRQIHSSTNLFRYDENIVFVKRELLPNIDLLRDQLMDRLRSSSSSLEHRWRDHFRVTLSFADGSSARVSAINASLKHYRPDYMHFWQLKTFWSELKICDDDVEWHSHEEISTETAMSIDALEGTPTGLVIDEMRRFIAAFEAVRNSPSGSNDLESFWLRKSRKPVLAVLLVEKGGVSKLYRGSNMEVSMPTGSLCAERNAIGSALADDLSLTRADLKLIAVYSPNTLSPGSLPTLTKRAYASSFEADEGRRSRSDSELQLAEKGTETSLSTTISSSHLEMLAMRGFTSPNVPFSLSQDGQSSDGVASQGSLGQADSSPQFGHKRKIMNTSLLRHQSSFQPATSYQQVHSAIVSHDGTANSKIQRTSNAITTCSIEFNLDLPVPEQVNLCNMSTVHTPVERHRVTNANSSKIEPVGRIGNRSRSSRRVLSTEASITQLEQQNQSALLWERDNSSAGVNNCASVDVDNSALDATITDLSSSLQPPTIIQVDENDLNPIKPCGACHEWLKKIAEVNPRFSVVTFTDVRCRGVYVEQITD